MRTSPRGFTLVELLITVAVTLVVISAALVGIGAQQRAYLNGRRLRDAQTAARRALLSIERNLPSAGSGMDAALAFDLSQWTTGPCPSSTMGTCPSDSTSNSDELTFFARDPRYWDPATNTTDLVGNAWRIQTVTGSGVTIAARPGDRFLKGQIFVAVCSGATSYAYFTASANWPSSGTVSTTSFQTIPLVPSNPSNPFLRQDAATATCFTTAGWSLPGDPPTDPARLFLINKYRYHVRPVATGAMGSATVYDPLLVLDRGLDLNGDGNVDDQDEVIVAEGIESLQVGYSFYGASAATPIPQAGVTAGTALTLVAGTPQSAGAAADTITTTTFPGTVIAGQSVYQPSSFYPYTYGPPPDPVRFTNHQGNFQLVRIAVLARSLEVDAQESRRLDQLLPVLNQSTAPTWVTQYSNALGGHDGYQRIVLETTVPLPSMSARAMPYF
jgi:type IV pilus assembly protein PilW